MKIKTKLFLGVGLLFVMIVILTALGILFVNRLDSQTKSILQANYNSVDYSRRMLYALNNDTLEAEELNVLDKNLSLQRNNITESGEKELTDKLYDEFGKLKNDLTNHELMKTMRIGLSAIMLLNMQAIERKEKNAESTVQNAILWITATGTVCFLIAFVLFVNLPGNIADPVKQLTESIRQIAEHDYSQRVHFQKRNEFGELASSFNAMAEKLEEYQQSNLQKLLMEKKRIETLISNMNDPVIGLDENRKILFMNEKALKISGLSLNDVINRPVQDIAMNNDLVRSLVKELFDPPDSPNKTNEPVKIYSDNKESYFEKEIIPINIIPTGEKKEQQIGTVILLQNITPYKELDYAKTHFIATVSHELKTPISSIQMSLQLLENKEIGNLNADQQNLVDSIRGDAQRLLKITSGLLNMTQVESGNLQLHPFKVSPAELIEYAVNANRISADTKNIRLRIHVAPDSGDVVADKEKTEWVITNLVSNAIRYSYDNSPVDISADRENDKVRFSVTDTGQGIAPDYLDKIFDRYFRVPGTKMEGTGLGLSISKEFIEAQGGHIEVKSEYGKGSTFSFTLNCFKPTRDPGFPS